MPLKKVIKPQILKPRCNKKKWGADKKAFENDHLKFLYME